ncbi:MAG TPA: hypothetical protein VFN10_20835 [Thermoanaerobaculia bacterium]|nr:hypothetical protein [Thermoanaerobaculia bacterium]
MWVFDGEEWTQDGGTTSSARQQEREETWTFDEFTPELQVIEIVPQLPKNPFVPPLPLP